MFILIMQLPEHNSYCFLCFNDEVWVCDSCMAGELSVALI